MGNTVNTQHYADEYATVRGWVRNCTRMSTQLYADEYATVREKSAYSVHCTQVYAILVEKGYKTEVNTRAIKCKVANGPRF